MCLASLSLGYVKKIIVFFVTVILQVVGQVCKNLTFLLDINCRMIKIKLNYSKFFYRQVATGEEKSRLNSKLVMMSHFLLLLLLIKFMVLQVTGTIQYTKEKSKLTLK